MTDRIRPAALAAAAVLLGRVAAGNLGGPFWSVNHFHYLPGESVWVWTLCGAALLLFFPLSTFEVKPGQGTCRSILVVGLLFYLAGRVLPVTGTPLLGDGLDRLEATLAGWRGMKGHPGPLDFAFHIAAFKLFAWSGRTEWFQSWEMWRTLSRLCLPIAAAAVFWLARLRSETRGGRMFVFFSILFAGTFVFFFGYVENYVFLSAAVYLHLLLIELHSRGRVPAAAVMISQIVLIGLHFFMALILPATIYALARRGKLRFPRSLIAAGAAAGAAFVGFSFYLVREYYGGVAAIFVPPSAWFSAYHLTGFIGQHLLACPHIVLLLPLGLGGGRQESDPLLGFLKPAAIIMAVFFFFLRPVIGPAADWDLFSIPSLFYVPALTLMAARKLDAGKIRPASAWAAAALALCSTGPWLSLNILEVKSIERFKDLMEWEAGYNPWAGSYGYVRLGKYLSRRGWERDNPEIMGSYRRALEINPGSATLHKQVAQLYAGLGEERLARDAMAQSHYLTGKYHEKKGDFKEAQKRYQAALDVAYDFEPAMEALAALYRGPLKDPGKALEMEKRLKALDDIRGGEAPRLAPAPLLPDNSP